MSECHLHDYIISLHHDYFNFPYSVYTSVPLHTWYRCYIIPKPQCWKEKKRNVVSLPPGHWDLFWHVCLALHFSENHHLYISIMIMLHWKTNVNTVKVGKQMQNVFKLVFTWGFSHHSNITISGRMLH